MRNTSILSNNSIKFDIPYDGNLSGDDEVYFSDYSDNDGIYAGVNEQ